MGVDVGAFVPVPAKQLRAEGQALADHAENTLRAILLRGSTRAVRPLLAFLKLKHRVSYPQLARITQLLFAIFESSAGDVGAEARVAGALAQALQVLNKLEDCPAVGSSGRLVIAWRPIYEAILRVSLRGASWAAFAIRGGDQLLGSEAEKTHLMAMAGLARRARNFFSGSAAGEIMDELRPMLCHHEMSLYKAVGLLCLFLPDHGMQGAGGAGQVLEELAVVWQTIPNSTEWHMLWITLFSRMARHNIEDVLTPLQALLHPLMATFLKLLEVPTGKTKPQRYEKLGWPSDCDFLLRDKKSRAAEECIKKYTRLIVFSIAPGSQTMPCVKELLTYLKPFFHPLQEGEHTQQLGMESGNHRCKLPWRSAHVLSAQDTADFTELILPFAMTSYYSKDYSMSFAAGQALKDLVSISTDVVLPKLLDMVVNSMQNVMKPHEVQNSISISSVLVGKILTSEGGFDLMGQLMQLSVAGIDTNDPMKTMATLRFYIALLAEMPLTDVNDVPAGASKPGILFGLQDWCAAVLDRAFDLLGNISDLKQGNAMKGHVQGLLRRFFTVFFQQMSPTLYKFCLDRVSRRCLSTFYPPGKQYIGYLLDAAVYGNCAQGVAQLVPALCSKIVKGNGDLQGSDAEAAYFVHILGHAISRAGKELHAYSAQIDAVLAATVLHTDTLIAKEGQKLLRKLLRSALDVRPEESRSWSGAMVPDFVAVCGIRCVPASAQITFRTPTDACQQRSRALIDTFFGRAEAVLKNANASSAEMRSAFGCLTGLVRGGCQLFLAPDMKEDSTGGDDDDDEDIVTSLQSPFKVQDAAWGVSTRSRLGQLLVLICRAQAIPENPDVQSVKALMRLVGVYLSSKGVWTKYENAKSSAAYNKAVSRNYEKGPQAAYPRELLVSRVYALVGKRADAGVFEEDSVASELLDKLGAMCMHEYSVVRKKAQKVLPAALKRYPRAATRLYTAMLQRLRDPAATKGTINGVVFSLQKSAALTRIARTWGLTHDLLTGLLSTQHFDETKVQVRLAELWNSYVQYTFPMAYGGLLHPSSLVNLPVMAEFAPQLVKDDFAAGTTILAERAERDRQTQATVVKVMQDALADGLKPSGATIHWRFTVLAAAALALQINRRRPADAATVKLFLQGLNSDILSLRQLCRAVLPVIFLSEQVSAGDSMEVEVSETVDKMADDPQNLWPENFDGGLSASYAGPYTDVTWLGWNHINDETQAGGHPAAFCEAALTVLASPEWIVGTVGKTSQDHNKSGDERADTTSAGAVTMPLASARIQAACDSRWLWPRTAAASFSADFSKNTMLTVESIVAATGMAGVNAMWSELEKAAVNAADRELQCTAAEMIAGIVRASHSLAASEQESLRTRLASLLTATLGAVTPDSVAVWSEMLRYIAANRDPRRLQWLAQIVLSLSDNISDDTGGGALSLVSLPHRFFASLSHFLPGCDISLESSTWLIFVSVFDMHGRWQAKALKFQQALLMEFTWRGMAMARAVTEKSRPLLGRSSKAVREEAGRAIVLVLRCMARFGRTNAASISQVPTFVSEWLPALLAQLHQTYTIALPAEGTPERLSLKNQIEGALYVFCHSSLLGHATSIGPLMTAGFPVMLAVQEDSDKEFAQVCVLTPSCSCMCICCASLCVRPSRCCAVTRRVVVGRLEKWLWSWLQLRWRGVSWRLSSWRLRSTHSPLQAAGEYAKRVSTLFVRCRTP
jgi:hypothetical protein